jgi:DNA processing protein
MREKLIALSIVKKGDWTAVHRFLQQDRKLASIDEERAIRLVEKLGCDVVTIFDEDYPSAWREMPKPPFVVYLKGNRELLHRPVIAVIGGKVISEYTKKEIGRMMAQLPANTSIINGFESGVEVCVNQNSQSRIVCLGSGVEKDEVYQKRNGYSELGTDNLVITELPPQADFSVAAYYRSYHLMAELAQVVCIFELANFDIRRKYLGYLTEIGKDVFVLPDRKRAETMGGLELINRGAKVLVDVGDVLVMVDGK